MSTNPRQFHSTRWSLIQEAGQGQGDARRDALNELCETYWYPLYAYVRRQGYDDDRARDLTQGFFARLIEKDVVAAADPERGRFRNFLLTAMKYYLHNDIARRRAIVRGGAATILPMHDSAAERYTHEPRHEVTPERAFHRTWALDMVDRAMERLREEWAGRGRVATFERLQGSLAGDATDYAAAAPDLGMTVGAVKVAVHRMRARFRELLRNEISSTVEQPEDVDTEIRDLFEALRGDS